MADDTKIRRDPPLPRPVSLQTIYYVVVRHALGGIGVERCKCFVDDRVFFDPELTHILGKFLQQYI